MTCKHFKQWASHLQLIIGSEERTSFAFTFWLEGRNAKNEVVAHSFNKKNLNLRAIINFCTNGIAPNDVKKYSFCAENKVDIDKVARGMFWYANKELQELRKYVLTSHLPLFSYAQSTEAAVKDMPACKTACRDKRNASAIASIRSVFCTLTKESVDSGEDFLNRKRKN